MDDAVAYASTALLHRVCAKTARPPCVTRTGSATRRFCTYPLPSHTLLYACPFNLYRLPPLCRPCLPKIPTHHTTTFTGKIYLLAVRACLTCSDVRRAAHMDLSRHACLPDLAAATWLSRGYHLTCNVLPSGSPYIIRTIFHHHYSPRSNDLLDCLFLLRLILPTAARHCMRRGWWHCGTVRSADARFMGTTYPTTTTTALYLPTHATCYAIFVAARLPTCSGGCSILRRAYRHTAPCSGLYMTLQTLHRAGYAVGRHARTTSAAPHRTRTTPPADSGLTYPITTHTLLQAADAALGGRTTGRTRAQDAPPLFCLPRQYLPVLRLPPATVHPPCGLPRADMQL